MLHHEVYEYGLKDRKKIIISTRVDVYAVPAKPQTRMNLF